MRHCYMCGEWRPVEEFAIDRHHSRGRLRRCKDCDNRKSRRYYQANREAKQRAARERNAAKRDAVGPRRCASCGEPATSSRHKYCDACRPEAEQRGYERRLERNRRRRASRRAS